MEKKVGKRNKNARLPEANSVKTQTCADFGVNQNQTDGFVVYLISKHQFKKMIILNTLS